MGLQLGDDFLLYWDSADTWATPTWALITPADDSLELDYGVIAGAFKKRGASDVKYKKGQSDPAVSFGVFYDKNHAFVTRLLNIESGANESVIIAIADGAIATTGTRYIKAEMTVSSLNFDGAVDNGAKYDVELRLFEGDNDRETATVGS